MTPEQIDRVFGRGRLKMVTGEHVEVFREAVVPGERRRYTKRFLEFDRRRLRALDGTRMAHPRAPDRARHRLRARRRAVRSRLGRGAQLVQTYDAGVTVDQWATLLPLNRDGHVLPPRVRGLRALVGARPPLPRRAEGDPPAAARAPRHQGRQRLHSVRARELRSGRGEARRSIRVRPARADRLRVFAGLAARASPRRCRSAGKGNTTINRRACSRRSRRVTTATCEPTRELDWRCDIYSLAAMLKRYLPDEARTAAMAGQRGWTAKRYDERPGADLPAARRHDRDFSIWRPHRELIEITAAHLADADLVSSLTAGWELARHVELSAAPSLRHAAHTNRGSAHDARRRAGLAHHGGNDRGAGRLPHAASERPAGNSVAPPGCRAPRTAARSRANCDARIVAGAALASPAFIGDPLHPFANQAREAVAALRSRISAEPGLVVPPVATADSPLPPPSAAAPPSPGGAGDAAERPSGDANPNAEDTPASEVGAPAPASAEPETPAPPESPVASDSPPPVAEAPAARAKAELAPTTTTSRKSAKVRAKSAEQAKRAGAASRPPQVARAGPPATDASRSRAAPEVQKPRRDVALSSVSAARSMRPAPVAQPVFTTPLAPSEPVAAAPSAMGVDATSRETPTNERAAASQHPARSQVPPCRPSLPTPSSALIRRNELLPPNRSALTWQRPPACRPRAPARAGATPGKRRCMTF